MNPSARTVPSTKETQPKKDDFTVTIVGLDPDHFAPISPVIVGGTMRVVIDFDRASGQCQMRTEPENGFSPAQLITVLASLLVNLTSVVTLNEQNFQRLTSGLGGANGAGQA